MNQKFKFLSLAALAAGGMAVAPASAQNTAHSAADLILTIQTNPGSTINIASLGAVSLFRDAAPGSFSLLSQPVGSNLSGNINLLSVLSGQYGSTWYDRADLWLGALDFRGGTVGSTTLLTGDPGGTLYFTQARTTIGTVGQVNSNPLNPVPTGSANGIISNMQVVINNAEITAAGAFPIVNLTPGTSVVDEQNPFVTPTLQDTAYGAFPGGIQGNFGLGTSLDGATLGNAGAVELGLDLFRVQFNNTVGAGVGLPNNTPQYLGTVTIAQNGDVGFRAANAVPEPTSMALIGLAGLGLAARRRRPASVNA